MSEPNYTQPDLTLLGEEHVKAYRETNGEVGGVWNGVPILLLTTKGRRTGLDRTIPIIYVRDGGDYVLLASYGGAPKHPAWYLNLLANPEAEIQVMAERIPVVARTATGAERERLWKLAAAQWPNYDVYQTRTDRVIPVVVLTPK
ncbi:MAG TPA: nitroreductase family deazaflavin-dependent oxidoreductase [Acidimicrobiales bacterium]